KTITSIQNKKSSDDVVLVVIDDISLKKISWPWRRDLYIDIFDFLENKAGAKAVILQNLILFPDTYNIDSDKAFYDGLRKHNKVINSYFFMMSNMAGDILPPEYINIFNTKKNLTIIDKRTKYSPSEYKGIVNLPKSFLMNANIFASSIIPEDNDEIVRTYMPVVKFQDKLYPSIALSAYSLYTGINSFVLYDNFLCSDDNCKTLKMPVFNRKVKDYIGNTFSGILSYYDWYKPISKFYTHKTYSAVDVLISDYAMKEGKPPKLSPELFKDKIVIVGLNADENVWEQLSETPVLNRQADIDVHATIISNMLNNSFKTLNHFDYTILITIVFCIFIARGFKTFKANIIFTSVFASVYLIYYLYEYFHNIYVPSVTPIITMYTTALLKSIYSLITTDKSFEMMKHAFGKYVSKDVMRKVISNMDKLKLGGTRGIVTILFVDIRNFTQISEDLAPQEVSSILNEYFSTIEPIIGKYHGIINKYMGDGVLAIFGEPIQNENHAYNAIKCGIEIIEKVRVLKEKFLSEGKPKIDIGIGVNTGDVFTGNIGTEERFEYTVIGDNVNLAYRIESYNQLLKTQFLISEYTYEYVKNIVDVVKLSEVKIKGKSNTMDIYEVLGIKEDVRK
ncbi:MAG: adenylate/guanylate cyclase domain-containing protein, partial [Candidatus Gastranaerophilales bacterium]|nr:adenylate/guanylate cyclase domain-containing protein [Candidatus Gastranaerophilales bacterium]